MIYRTAPFSITLDNLS